VLSYNSFTKGKKGGRPAAAPTSPSHSSAPGDGGVGVAVCDLPGAGGLPAVLGEHVFGGGQRLGDDVVGVRVHGDRPSGDLATEGVEGLAVDLPDLLAAQHFNGAATVVGDVVGQRDRDGVVPSSRAHSRFLPVGPWGCSPGRVSGAAPPTNTTITS